MSETESKRNPASSRKIQKQREEGSVPQATEIATMGAAAISLVFLIFWMMFSFRHLAGTFDITALLINERFETAFDKAIKANGVQLVLAVVPVAAMATLTTILITMIYNKGPVFAIKPIVPDFKRISFGAGIKRLFGMRTWLEVGQALTRLIIWGTAALIVLLMLFKSILMVNLCGEACAIHIASVLFFRLAVIAVLVLIVSAGIESLVQKFVFLHEQRMTNTEVKRENKEQQGSPELRKERNRLRQEAREGGEASTINHANMCFYWKERSIAVRYHPEHAKVPMVTGRANSPVKCASLVKQVKDNGYPSLEHQGVVEAAFKIPPGSPMGEETHDQLIDALQKLYG